MQVIGVTIDVERVLYALSVTHRLSCFRYAQNVSGGRKGIQASFKRRQRIWNGNGYYSILQSVVRINRDKIHIVLFRKSETEAWH